MSDPAAPPFAVQFELPFRDRGSFARRGILRTPHGPVETPAFMPVGTQAAVKAVGIDALAATGTQMVLANTYHLAIRPGETVVAALGGLHAMMGWRGPILTDSGGFQIFSLAENAKITEQGATFRSHLDGSLFVLTPERAIEIQEALGADVAMVLDHVVALPNDREVIRDAVYRSIRWAVRCRNAARKKDQAQFAIVQGGLDADLRRECARQLVALDFPGYAVGGLSVGEPPEEMYRTLDATLPELPENRPRYLMGVGRPEDLLEGIRRGIDLFDCVMPTRNGRNALAFTDRGRVRLKNKRYERAVEPLDEHCPCPACRHSLGYLRHLFMANEMLGPMLLSIHNVTYYQRLMVEARRAIEAQAYSEFCAEKYRGWQDERRATDA